VGERHAATRDRVTELPVRALAGSQVRHDASPAGGPCQVLDLADGVVQAHVLADATPVPRTGREQLGVRLDADAGPAVVLFEEQRVAASHSVHRAGLDEVAVPLSVQYADHEEVVAGPHT